MKVYVYPVIWFVCFACIPFRVEPQVVTAGETLKRIVEDACRKGVFDEEKMEVELGAVCPGKEVRIRMEGGVMTDMGVVLFPTGLEKARLAPVYDFIERYFFYLLVQAGREEQQHLLRSNRMGLLINGKPLGRGGGSVEEALQGVTPETPFVLESDSAHFRVSWKRGKEAVSLLFPKQYDLILGKDKMELSRMLKEELLAYEYTRPEPVFEPERFQLTPVSNLFFDRGDCFLIAQMKSGKYIRKEGDRFGYVCNERFGEESLLNLFSWADEMGWKGVAGIQVQGYHGFTDNFTCTLDRLCSFMKSRNCRAYVGIKTAGSDRITGTVVYVNEDLMYEHLLSFSFPVEAFKKNEVPVTVKWWPYIPLNNVTTLYDEETELTN